MTKRWFMDSIFHSGPHDFLLQHGLAAAKVREHAAATTASVCVRRRLLPGVLGGGSCSFLRLVLPLRCMPLNHELASTTTYLEMVIVLNIDPLILAPEAGIPRRVQ